MKQFTCHGTSCEYSTEPVLHMSNCVQPSLNCQSSHFDIIPKTTTSFRPSSYRLTNRQHALGVQAGLQPTQRRTPNDSDRPPPVATSSAEHWLLSSTLAHEPDFVAHGVPEACEGTRQSDTLGTPEVPMNTVRRLHCACS